MDEIGPYVSSIVASAICTAMVMYGFTRRRDGTRRLIFAIGAAVVVPVIVMTLLAQQSPRGTDFTLAKLLIGLPTWLALVGGTFIAGMGWLGFARRVGDHPYCRQCGFDLFGKPEESVRCGECGADLNAKKAVVTGVRVRRYKLIGCSLFLFFLGILVGGRPTYQWVASVKWEQHKPLWWLKRDLSTSNARAGRKAEQELVRRFVNKELSSQQVISLIKHQIAQPPASRSANLLYFALDWSTANDDLEEADARGLMQAASQVGAVSVVPKLTRDMPIPFRAFGPFDAANRGNFTGTSSKMHVQLGGVDLPAPTAPGDGAIRRVDPGPLWSQIPDGPTQLVVRVDAEVHFRTQGRELIEPVTMTLAVPAVVATGAAAEAPATQPTERDAKAVWSAVFGQPYHDDDRSRGLHITATDGQTRVVARVFLIDSAGRDEIGTVDGHPGRYQLFTAGPRFRRPAFRARLELIPARDLTRNNWDQSPFLDQIIRIDAVGQE